MNTTIDMADYRIARLVDELFATARYGSYCQNPVTGEGYVHGVDPVASQKDAARRALLAREWFALNGPADAQPLPLWCDECQRFGLLAYITRLYSRSLADRKFDVRASTLRRLRQRRALGIRTRSGWGRASHLPRRASET